MAGAASNARGRLPKLNICGGTGGAGKQRACSSAGCLQPEPAVRRQQAPCTRRPAPHGQDQGSADAWRCGRGRPTNGATGGRAPANLRHQRNRGRASCCARVRRIGRGAGRPQRAARDFEAFRVAEQEASPHGRRTGHRGRDRSRLARSGGRTGGRRGAGGRGTAHHIRCRPGPGQ